MTRRAAAIAVAAVLVGLLFATVTTSGGVGMWSEPQWDPTPAEPTPIEVNPDGIAGDAFDEVDRSDNEGIEIPRWLRVLLNAIGTMVAIIAAIALLIAGWRHRPRLRWRRPDLGAGGFDTLPDVAEAVADQAAAHRAALLSGEVRNSIVACWLRLEQDVAEAGLARPPADTSAEFTERVLGEYSVDADAIGELAALYREARFSDHELDESARHAALAALDRLHRSLVDGRAQDHHVTERDG